MNDEKLATEPEDEEPDLTKIPDEEAKDLVDEPVQDEETGA